MTTNGVEGLGLLGDPTRRAIFELLARHPRTVGELAQQLPITRSAVSQHLRVLKDGGLPDIAQLFKLAGRDFDDLALARAAEIVDYLNLSDAERKQVDLERQNAELKAEQERQKAEREQQEYDQHSRFVSTTMESAIPQALKEAGLPQTPSILQRMSAIWLDGIKGGRQDEVMGELVELYELAGK